MSFTRMEVYDGPDREGRYHYALFWMQYKDAEIQAGVRVEAGVRERGQHFRAIIKPEYDSLPTKDFRSNKETSWKTNS